ncbi:MAG: hypothetical protein HF982_13585 [Desulfobacteraceae bacterium]|nr:hypothetical protein [Desulfobacteraceae bacterium]MBC2720591.1 hypothetical protein [Desulfobacteraceae bacterium]
MKIHWVVLIVLCLVCSCSTCEIREHYTGSTEQRLISLSINKLMTMLPEKDFSILRGEKVLLRCYFLELTALFEYAQKRLKMELMDNYQCQMVESSDDANLILHVFFTSLGTDIDKFGITTPDLVLPVMGGISSMDLIALSMFHGITELYYYVLDSDHQVLVKGKRIKSVTRNDSLSLPFITIPINTVN